MEHWATAESHASGLEKFTYSFCSSDTMESTYQDDNKDGSIINTHQDYTSQELE